jgi:hypothetical protein
MEAVLAKLGGFEGRGDWTEIIKIDIYFYVYVYAVHID